MTVKLKAPNCYKTIDYYKYYRLIRPAGEKYNILERKYSKILQDVTLELMNIIIKEALLKLPYKIGTLFLKRTSVSPRIKDGKLVYNAPVDWGETNKLWKEDPEAKLNKKVIKVKPGNIYYIKYLSGFSNYGKMRYYSFTTTRSNKREKLKSLGQSKEILGMSYYDSLINKKFKPRGGQEVLRKITTN